MATEVIVVCVEANVMVAQLRCRPPSVLLHNLAPEKCVEHRRIGRVGTTFSGWKGVALMKGLLKRLPGCARVRAVNQLGAAVHGLIGIAQGRSPEDVVPAT